MKALKRVQIVVIGILMTFCMISGTAYAAEIPNTEETIAVYDFEITPDMSENEIVLLSDVNNTFNIYGSHTGSSRNYYGNKLRYSITITDVNGNPANNILAVQLFASNGIQKHEGQFWADGALNIIQEIPISYGSAYYFKYIQAYGDLRTLRIHMEITAYN